MHTHLGRSMVQEYDELAHIALLLESSRWRLLIIFGFVKILKREMKITIKGGLSLFFHNDGKAIWVLDNYITRQDVTPY